MSFPLPRTELPTQLHLRAASLITALFLLTGTSHVFADDSWTGGGAGSNWNTSANWSGGVPSNTYGILYFNDQNGGKTTLTDDINSMAQNGLRWYDDQSWTINSSDASNVINFYDNAGTQAEIQNNSTGSVTINVSVNFAANNSSTASGNYNGFNPFGQIDAVNGDLTFGAGTLTVSGPSVYGLRLFGGTARNTTFDDTVNANNATNGGNGDKYIALIGPVVNGMGTGTNMTVGGTFNSGDIYVMDGSTLNLAAGGMLVTGAVRLGGDFGTTGYQDLTVGGTFNLAAVAGGQTFGSTITTVPNNTSNALNVNSQNTSGTNTISGGIYLDSPLNINANSAGGTLALTGTVDVKAQTLNIAGAGVVNMVNGIQSSAGGGTVNYNGSGTLLLNGTGSNAGTTNINSGTLGGVGTLAGPVNVNPGAAIHPANIDGNGVLTPGTLSTGALTLASTSTSIFDLASNTTYGQVVSSGAISLAGSLSVNVSSTFAYGTTFDLARGTSLTGTYSGIANNGFYTFGGQQFEAEYTGTDFELVAVPEPATYLGGILLIGLVGISQRRRLYSFLAKPSAVWIS